MNNLFNLDGKVAVVTGGAGLLGKAFARALAASGATVFIAELNRKAGQSVSEELRKENLDVRDVHLDISHVTSIQRCIHQIEKETDAIDIWINNAYPRTKDWHLDFENIPTSSWRKNVDQHLNGYCFCCQQVAERMKKRRKGSIINLASTYGICGPRFSIYNGTAMTMPAAYAAIKGGILNFTRYLASYYGRYGIRANSISPGGIFNGQPARFVKRYSKNTPLGRMARPDDIAGAAVYLASDAASYVTGHNLVVDGGWTSV